MTSRERHQCQSLRRVWAGVGEILHYFGSLDRSGQKENIIPPKHPCLSYLDYTATAF